MRDVAVVSFAKAELIGGDNTRNEVEILMPVVHEAIERAGIDKREIGFTCSGSCDYLQGQPFAFVTALDAIGAWPPIEESHVEMDAAWALYEAWVRLQHGDIDSALVYGFGKPSLGSLPDVFVAQLDPYYLQPLWPDAHSLAALQARALAESGVAPDARSATAVSTVPTALQSEGVAPITDGAAAVVLAAGDVAQRLSPRPAWIAGVDHRSEPHHPGMRDLTRSASAELAAERAGAFAGAPIEVAELHAQYAHEEAILRSALRLGAGVRVNPSGGALAANPVMATGLIRIGEAAQRVIDGEATRALAHAASGPCLQQNLVCVLEARA